MENRLWNIFTNVNEWLKFAESKNSILLAADTGLGIGIYQLFLSRRESVFSWERICVSMVVTLLLAGSVICLFSFLPNVKIPWLTTIQRPSDDDNVLFYGDIAKYAPERYLRLLYERVGMEWKDNAIEKDLAAEIIINSRIALRKYRLFGVALWINFFALLVLCALILVKVTM